jgi:phage-related protein
VPILALVSPLVEFMAPAIKFVAEVLAFLIGVIVEVISWIIKFSTGNKEVVDIVTNAWQAVLDFFAGIPAAVGGFFKDAGTWLVDAGRNIIQGFINGIQGMIGAVGDAVGGIMDFVAGFFPRSPAKRGPFSGAGWTALRRSGLAIADQFGSGLELGWVGLNSSMGGISPTLSVPDGARANEGGITLIVQGGLDSGATIGRRVVAALEDYQRSGGSLRVVRQG